MNHLGLLKPYCLRCLAVVLVNHLTFSCVIHLNIHKMQIGLWLRPFESVSRAVTCCRKTLQR